MLDSVGHQPLDSLLDITSNIQIESNFCISHPNYQPFALPTKVADRFQQTSPALRHKYLTLLLRNFIYGIYYNASLQNILTVNDDALNFQPHQIENTSTLGIDWGFYERLHASNHGTGYFDPGWEVLRQEPDGSMAVNKGGLTLYIEPDSHLEATAEYPRLGDLVPVLMPKNRLQNGLYIAVGNVTQEDPDNPDADLGTGRIYFNLTSSGAIALMDSLTLKLNAGKIPFSFQVLYNPNAYGRYDSGVLYFERQDYPVVRDILQKVYLENQSHFQEEIPLFTKFLAPGLSLAEEPVEKFAAQESFGINRCQIVANALLEAWEKGHNSAEERMAAIKEHFAQHFIDFERPYLNPSSEDIYHPLN